MRIGIKVGLLASVAILVAAAFGGWKYWQFRQQVVVERLAMDGEPGKQLAHAIMDKMYGKEAYDSEAECWSVEQKASKSKPSFTYCMQPIALDKAQISGQHQLYLFATNIAHDFDHDFEAVDEGWGGAFVVDAETLEPIAGKKLLPVVNDSRNDIGSAKLMQLSKDGVLGWLVVGSFQKREMPEVPQIFIVKDKKIIDASGNLYGSDSAYYSSEYELDATKTDAGFYPLRVKIKNREEKTIASFNFRFDKKSNKYLCADQACHDRKGMPEYDESSEAGEQETEAPPPANANEALFNDNTKLSDADLKDILGAINATYVVKDQKTWGFVTPQCHTPFPLNATIPDDAKADQKFIWIEGGDSCTSGNTENSVWLFIRGEDGHLRSNLGVPAKKIIVTEEHHDGYNDIRLSGNGFCEAIWRWDGNQYQHLKNIATQPGGCDSK